MQRFFDNYGGQVSIPKVPAPYDTSNDEALAKTFMDEALPPPTDGDEEIARILHNDAPPPATDNDVQLARILEGESPLPDTGRDADMARFLQNETPLSNTHHDAHLARFLQDNGLQPATHGDEAMARTLQEDIDRGHTGAAQPRRSDRRVGLQEDFERLSYAEQRRLVLDGYEPVQGMYRFNYTSRAAGLREERHPPPG
jgi:hypothetical protein